MKITMVINIYYYSKYMTLKRIRNDSPIKLSFGSIPITLYYDIIDKETHVSIYGPDLNTSITLYKVLNIEIDYNSRAYSKIQSLQLNYADTLDLDNTERIFAKVDSLLPSNIKLNINKQFEYSASYFPSGNFCEVTGGFNADVPDTIGYYDDTLYKFSNYCYNSADAFYSDPYLGYQYSVHLIFSGNPSEMGPLDYYPFLGEAFGATILAYGNMKWDSFPDPNYNNYIYIFVNTAYNYYYNTHHHEYDNIEDLHKDFINLLAMVIAHELGHNIGHLEHYNDPGNIMSTYAYWGIQDSLNRHFEDFQNISIQNESQFYFRIH